MESSAVGFELLGPLSIEVAGIRYPVRTGKARTLLGVLALNPGRMVGFDELIDELWPECALRNARNTLHVVAMRLRKQLDASGVGPDYSQLISTWDSGYELRIRQEATDAHRFLQLAERGRALSPAQPGRAIESFAQALELWRGLALSNVEGRRCRAAATWLDEQRIVVAEDLMTARLRAGQERSAAAELAQLVSRYPEREQFSAQLMLALYRCGRQQEALSVFHRTRRWLDSEFGLQPHQSLHEMYRAILAQDPGLAERALSAQAR
jgi:DNA-binding SARP family transcriptional activator